MVEIDRDALQREQALGFLEHRQGLQPEEVELHQPRRLDIFHVELGDRHVRARIAVERDELVERRSPITTPAAWVEAWRGKPLELHRQVEQAADAGVILIFGGELGNAVERARQVPRLGGWLGISLARRSTWP